MRLKSLLQLLYLFIFLVTLSPCTSAVVDVGIQEVTVSELSPDYPTDNYPEPGEEFEVNVTIKNYGDEATEGTIVVYLDDEKKDSWGAFSIKAGEVVSQQFMISHGDCNTYNINIKIVMNKNTPNHDWEVSKQVKIGKKFYVTVNPEKAVVNKPIYVNVKNDLGLNVENVKICIGGISGVKYIKYKCATSKENEIFSFTPDHTGNFLINITKEKEGYCGYIQQIEVRHNLTVYGPYPNDNPISGDNIVIKVYDEENEPVPGVAVNVIGAENIYRNTDQSGGVLFVINKAGEYHIEIEKSTPPYWGVNKTVYVQAKPRLLINVSPEKPLLGDDVAIEILNENASNVNITITNPNGFERMLTTGEENKVNFNVKLLGTYVIRAEHDNYTAATKEIDVFNLLKILFEPENPAIGDNITIIVLDQDSYPVPNALVSIKGKEEVVKTTDHNGEVKFKLKSRNYKIIAEKKDYINATASVNVIVKKLSLDLSSKKLKIDTGTIHISVTEEDMGISTSAKITIEGESTGFKVEKTASEFTFTPEFADNYRISAAKDTYDGAEDSFVIEPASMDIYTSLNKKEIVIKITIENQPLPYVNVSVGTPTGKTLTSTDDKGVARISIEKEGEGKYTIFASKPPNYESSEVGVSVIKNQEYWWLWLILLIILITGILLWKF